MYSPEHILLSLEPAIAKTRIPAPMAGDKWLVSSSMQKAIRRGDTDRALSAATSLWQHDRQNFWRRISTASSEDCSGDTDAVIVTLAATAHSVWRRRVGDLKAGLYLTRLLCESVKSRAADELYLLLERSSTYKTLREQFAQADDSWLGDCVLDEHAPLHERALAAWYLAGLKKYPSEVMPFRQGNPEEAKKVLRMLNAPDDLIESCIGVMNRTGWPLALFVPLLWQVTQGEDVQVVESTLPLFALVNGIPTFGCDLYTRIGGTCYRILRNAVPELKPFTPKQIGIGQFHAEGGLLDKYISSPNLKRLRYEADKADAEHVGLCAFTYEDLRQILATHADLLQQIREEQLRKYFA